MDRLWYVAYGSNLASARFTCYLVGGRPLDGLRSYPGCRDATEPTANRAVLIQGAISFTGVSSVWGGGSAVYDPRPSSQVAGRAYLLTTGQLSDIAAQEMHRLPDADLELGQLLTARSHRVGPGRYETLLHVGTLDGRPMVTITATSPSEGTLNAPSAAYLRVIADGLRETHGWGARRIGTYLAAAPGARGSWTADAIAALLEPDDFDRQSDPANRGG